MRRFSSGRWIPQGAVAVEREGLGGIVYQSPEGAEFIWAMGYVGKQSKPAFHYRFKSVESRAAHVEKFWQSLEASAKYKAERQAAKRAFVPSLKVGSILSGVWGYEQSNVEFYEVVGVSGKSVEIRELAHEQVPSEGYSSMAGLCKPVPGQYIGPVLKKRVAEGNSVKIHSSCSVSPWSGRPVYWSSYA